jgi:hypothetical protein
MTNQGLTRSTHSVETMIRHPAPVSNQLYPPARRRPFLGASQVAVTQPEPPYGGRILKITIDANVRDQLQAASRYVSAGCEHAENVQERHALVTPFFHF